MVDLSALGHDETLRELDTEDGVLRYHEAGTGPALLLLHGSGPGVTGWRNFRHNLPALAEHFRCLVLELPGFGVSHATDRHPLMAAPRAVSAFLGDLGLDRVDVVGNSMGGVIALQLASSAASPFRRIVTVGGVGANLLSPFPAEGMNLLMDFTDEPTREGLVRWLHSMVTDRSMVTEEMVQERWEQATDPPTLASARSMYGREAMMRNLRFAAQSDRPPYWAMLHKVSVPTLLTWGRDDRVSPLDMALLPMRTIPRAELHVLPDCGHWAMIEQRALWERVVIEFLTRPDDATNGGDGGR